MEDSAVSVEGPGRLNQLGGTYVNGKPIPKEVREEIIALAQCGVRPCEISRRLRITHGCISKLLSKYQQTGTVDPGGENVGRPRVITSELGKKIEEYRQEQPGIFSWEIRNRLLHENVCSAKTLPSLSSISRMIKNKIRSELSKMNNPERCDNTSYMVATLSNLPSNKDAAAANDTCQAYEFQVSDPDVAESRKRGGDPNLYQIQRRERTKYTSQQIYDLEAAFQKSRYPSAAARDQLAKKIGINEARIQVWFSNRRSKVKKRRHTVDHTDLITQQPPECTCRRYSVPLVPPQPIKPGPSRIMFPPGHV